MRICWSAYQAARLPLRCGWPNPSRHLDELRTRAHNALMSRAFSFIALIIVVAAGMYFYMRQAQGVSPDPASNPAATVNLVGVQQNLLRFARAEQQHLASDGRYFTLAEMRAAGDTGLPSDSRAEYVYSIEVSGNSFTATAVYSGPPTPGVPRVLRIGPAMAISSE